MDEARTTGGIAQPALGGSTVGSSTAVEPELEAVSVERCVVHSIDVQDREQVHRRMSLSRPVLMSWRCLYRRCYHWSS